MATIPSPPTFTATQKLSAASMNTNVRDATNFLIAQPLCALSNSTAQPIATSTVTAVAFDTESTDTDSMHSTTSTTSRITAVTPGWYQMAGNVPYQANATGSRWIAFQVNGVAASRIGFAQYLSTGGTTDTAVSSSAPVFLAVGDYVEMVTWQNSGGTLNIDTANGGARLTALWIHA